MVNSRDNRIPMDGVEGGRESLALQERVNPQEEASHGQNNMENEEEIEEDEDEYEGEDPAIPLHRWVMHGAVMFGREFCYAMETALVTPVVLQIGLPEQYYSLTWFLSPVLGLLFTPWIGSASDRCMLRWGRRRPFILALCVGVLLGVALFLNGSMIGLSYGDAPGNQPIGIVLTVAGVVLLDFCADASEGPIRAYLLDVADTEEQDIALNVHAFSAGLGGAVGYVLGGLDWTGTALGRRFKSQEQVLFMFASIIFIISVTLHMFSIPEVPITPQLLLRAEGSGGSDGQLSLRPGNHASPLDDITEEAGVASAPNGSSDPARGDVDLPATDRVRSKSDSVLAKPNAAIQLDPDLDPDAQRLPPKADTPTPSTPGRSPAHTDGAEAAELRDPELSPLKKQAKVTNGVGVVRGTASTKLASRSTNNPMTPRLRSHTFYRQPSFSFSYHGRMGSHRFRRRQTSSASPQPISSSSSLSDVSELERSAGGARLQMSASSLLSCSSCSDAASDPGTTVRLLWLSMLKMPNQLWRLCVCHLITWFSYIAEAVFYTDFMGQVIYQGDPMAPANSTELQDYNRGVQMGCWGLVVYAATAALCSALLQKYLDNFDLSVKVLYMLGPLGFSAGTAIMAIFPNVYVAMVMISSMGVISLSMTYCPYTLLGQYHEDREYIHHSPENTKRGFGIDCAILSCQVYISQILVASALGAVVEAVGTVRVIPMVASVASFFGFVAAFFLVVYPDEEPSGSVSDRVTAAWTGEPPRNTGRVAPKPPHYVA